MPVLEIIPREQLLLVKQEIEQGLFKKGVDDQERVQLWHELGCVCGALGHVTEQRKAWERAIQLDPANEMVKSSLESLPT